MEPLDHKHLKKIREDLRLSQSEFAIKLGISRELLSNIETGKAPLTNKTKRLVSEKFDVIINELKDPETNYKKTIKVTNANIGEIVGEIFEKIVRIESHLEVYEQAIADIKSTSKADFMKTIGVMRKEVAEVSNRRFSELQMQYG